MLVQFLELLTLSVAVKSFWGGYTPLPIDKYGHENKQLVKVSLGAEKVVKWSRIRVVGKFLDQARKDGYSIVGLEIHKDAIDYTKLKLSIDEFARTILLLGNEKRGLSKAVLKRCDKIIKIPMSGVKESLNVSVAFGIAAFAMRDNKQ